MRYLLINTNEYNGTQIGVNIFYASPIKSGEHIGKYATSENALNEFPEIFENLTYETADLNITAFQRDYTLPQVNPYYLEVLPEFLGVFTNNKFMFEGYEIPLYEIQSKKCVNTAHFDWQQFKDDLDEKLPDGTFKHIAMKNVLMKLWDDLLMKYTNNQFIIE
jgi:hypothetical protein